MWDIPVSVSMLAEKLPKGVMPGPPAPMGVTQRGASFAGGTTNPGWFGPGADFRRYDLELYALKTEKFMAGNSAVNAIRMMLNGNFADKVGFTFQPIWGSRGGNTCPAGPAM